MAEGFNKRRLDLNEPYSSDTTKPPSKKRKTMGRHHTSKDELEVLSILKVHKDKLSDDVIANVCEHLSDVWTIKKVQEWWYYHKDQ